MHMEPGGRPLRWYGRVRRFAVRHPASVLLLFAVPIGVVAYAALLAGRFALAVDIVKVGTMVLLLLSPALLIEAAFLALRGVRAVRRRVDNRRAARNPQPSRPPIEQIAADLRRLLWLHDTFVRSDDVAAFARRLCALEAAITERATQAARALDVPYPDRPALGGFEEPQLRRLLRALAAEGLVLPAAVALLEPDNRFWPPDNRF